MHTSEQSDYVSYLQRYKEIAISCLKLGTIGFGGIAGMVATIEDEMVNRRKWINHEHFMDVLSTSYIIPGPNAVEVVMHCGKERGGRLGLIIAGICYILPAMLICLLFGFFYQKYHALPNFQRLISGIRPATTALVFGTVFRLVNTTMKNKPTLIGLCILVFIGSIKGLNEILLITGAGAIYYIIHTAKNNKMNVFTGLLCLPLLLQLNTQTISRFSQSKLFFIFLKIGAILYGSGYVLFAYMDEAFVRNNHWLTRQQLMDAIAVGQITPGPILSSATFAGYLIDGTMGGILATVAIFLPSFFISFFLHKVISYARRSDKLRIFLDGLNAASISIIAVVGFHMLASSFETQKSTIVLSLCLSLVLFVKNINTLYIIVIGSLLGFFL